MDMRVEEQMVFPFTSGRNALVIKSFPAMVKYLGESSAGYFVNGNVYKVLGQEKGLYRVIDETGEDYLYFLGNKFQLIET